MGLGRRIPEQEHFNALFMLIQSKTRTQSIPSQRDLIDFFKFETLTEKELIFDSI